MERFLNVKFVCSQQPDLCVASHVPFRDLLVTRLFQGCQRIDAKNAQQPVKTGTIVDATIIAAPSSTKNADKQRDPEMHQTRKSQQWYFGMKLHFGVDSQSGPGAQRCGDAG